MAEIFLNVSIKNIQSINISLRFPFLPLSFFLIIFSTQHLNEKRMLQKQTKKGFHDINSQNDDSIKRNHKIRIRFNQTNNYY